MDNFECGQYTFSSKFDSGNLERVELVRCGKDSEPVDNSIYAEFNVWTTPDCFGTLFENPNRTWFFFSIRGGQPCQNVKINVMNLNRQAKLFSQGMQPVFRIGINGKWERIKENPSYVTETDNFSISFIHRSLNNPKTECFYAFTYPFTYTDCQQMLEKFDDKYLKCVDDINYLIWLANSDYIDKLRTAQVKDKLDSFDTQNKYLPLPVSMSEQSTTTGQITNSKFPNDKLTQKDRLSEIYYHRELLVKSIEGRRVDLVTISSFHGIQDYREKRISYLFPETNYPRCHCFKNKKIIFLSSRVHPGETPASFVLNGFINLLLDKKSIIGSLLRQLYVFKIVPILNPDGVYNGMYRTDTLGHNLNRMYINPKLEYQPSIYAVKKIIEFYHFGMNFMEDHHASNFLNFTNPSSKNRSVSADVVQKEVLPKYQKSKVKEKMASEYHEKRPHKVRNSTIVKDITRLSTFSEKCVPKVKSIPQESCLKKKICYSTKLTTASKKTINLQKNFCAANASSAYNNNIENKCKNSGNLQQKSLNETVIQKKDIKAFYNKNSNLSSKANLRYKDNISNNNVPLSSSCFMKANASKSIKRMKSNIFLYIDFHGHASKRGVFMYGNHFSNVAEAADCMLLPRLMSINSQHFHYDACNFSERNMYKKEKRDGLSKEGSARVAIYRMTGLIMCYTLESNYNSGKYINVLPQRRKDNIIKSSNLTPPKYTPAIFEEVGRALGPSILDLTNSNIRSRIQYSEFHSLQGIKFSLQNNIERNLTRQRVISRNITSTKVNP